MRILITNDDGIHAPGLKILREIAERLSDDVWTVAPATNQSATSHSMTLYHPLRISEIAPRQISVDGTPTDCVIMAVRHVLKDHKPDLILSGVNHGSNLAEDVTYSGTIAAAMEGTLVGIRSIALSLMTGFDDAGKGRALWETPLAHGPDLIERLLKTDWGPGILVNVNFPDLPPDEVQGVSITTQGQRDQSLLHIDQRNDPWGTPYFWFGFERRHATLLDGTDLTAIASGRISVTPLSLNLTDLPTCNSLAQAFASAKAAQAKG